MKMQIPRHHQRCQSLVLCWGLHCAFLTSNSEVGDTLRNTGVVSLREPIGETGPSQLEQRWWQNLKEVCSLLLSAWHEGHPELKGREADSRQPSLW